MRFIKIFYFIGALVTLATTIETPVRYRRAYISKEAIFSAGLYAALWPAVITAYLVRWCKRA